MKEQASLIVNDSSLIFTTYFCTRDFVFDSNSTLVNDKKFNNFLKNDTNTFDCLISMFKV